MSTANHDNEQFSFSLFGLKFACSNPGKRTVIIIIVLLVFIIIMTILLNKMVLPALVFWKGKTLGANLWIRICNLVKK